MELKGAAYGWENRHMGLINIRQTDSGRISRVIAARTKVKVSW